MTVPTRQQIADAIDRYHRWPAEVAAMAQAYREQLESLPWAAPDADPVGDMLRYGSGT